MGFLPEILYINQKTRLQLQLLVEHARYGTVKISTLQLTPLQIPYRFRMSLTTLMKATMAMMVTMNRSKLLSVSVAMQENKRELLSTGVTSEANYYKQLSSQNAFLTSRFVCIVTKIVQLSVVSNVEQEFFIARHM